MSQLFLRRFAIALTAIFMIMLFSSIADAAPASNVSSVGDLATNFKTQMTAVGDAILVGAMIVGVVFAIVGIVKMTKGAREEGGMAKALVLVAAGALLIAIPGLMMAANKSIFGGEGAKSEDGSSLWTSTIK